MGDALFVPFIVSCCNVMVCRIYLRNNKEKARKKRPKLFRVTHVLHSFALTIYKLLVSAYVFCRRDVNKKYKTAGDSVDLVEVLAFSL